MQKQTPSIGRILVAVGFALSCFALLLFLWVTFGGPTPFEAQSYRFTASFPEAVTLAQETDVRRGGVSIGKVKKIGLPPAGNVTEAEMTPSPSSPRSPPIRGRSCARRRCSVSPSSETERRQRGRAACPRRG